jgi:hypothetical protein
LPATATNSGSPRGKRFSAEARPCILARYGRRGAKRVDPTQPPAEASADAYQGAECRTRGLGVPAADYTLSGKLPLAFSKGLI